METSWKSCENSGTAPMMCLRVLGPSLGALYGPLELPSDD
jgi:hypothetical protein